MNLTMMAHLRARRDGYGFQYPYGLYFPSVFDNPYASQHSAVQATPPAQTAPQAVSTTPRPSQIDELLDSGARFVGTLAAAYIKFVALPNLQRQARAEFEEAVRKNRTGDALALLAMEYGLNKLNGD